MSLRIFALIYMACFAALSMGLYLVKYSVQNIQHEVEITRADLAREKESLHLLKAEWAYLNRPDRLRQLAERHLDLIPLDSKRMENLNLIPAATSIDTQSPEASAMFQPVVQTVEGK